MRTRRYFAQREMEEVWDRWENGEPLNSIARGLERGHSAVQGILARTGGVRPAAKKRSRLALTLAEREKISRGIADLWGRIYGDLWHQSTFSTRILYGKRTLTPFGPHLRGKCTLTPFAHLRRRSDWHNCHNAPFLNTVGGRGRSLLLSPSSAR